MSQRSDLSTPFAGGPDPDGDGPEPEAGLVVPGPVQRRTKAANWVNVALGAAVLVAVAGVSFAAGRLTAPATTAGAFNGQGGGRQFPGNGEFPNGGFGGQDGQGPRGFGGGLALTGTVDAVSGSTLTLKLADGRTIQVSLSDTTTYHAQASATSSDVAVGKTVIVEVQGFRPGNDTTGGGTSATDVTVVP
jgi:hypothetical protein